jgi:type II secretory pathway pseudopilin PulG
MSVLGYIVSHPIDAGRRFWRAFTGTETLSERIEEEEAKIRALKTAISLYYLAFNRQPESLRDLCFNNHNDSAWTGPFINWHGEDTFHDTFGFPYRYANVDGSYELISPGLEAARSCDAGQVSGGD